MVKVKSKTDVITNSSTEVYMMNDKNSLKSIKNLVNAFLEKGGSTQTFDDLFTAETDFNRDSTFDEYEDVRQELPYWRKKDFEPYKEFLTPELELLPWDSLSEEQIRKFAKIHSERDDLYEPLMDNGYVFKAKNESDKELAELLNGIISIYTPTIYSN